MDAALEHCAQASPRLKQQIIQALVAVVATDGQVKRREAEPLRAIADTLDCPIPPFLNTTPDPSKDDHTGRQIYPEHDEQHAGP
jgi:hypothetical protein